MDLIQSVGELIKKTYPQITNSLKKASVDLIQSVEEISSQVILSNEVKYEKTHFIITQNIIAYRNCHNPVISDSISPARF